MIYQLLLIFWLLAFSIQTLVFVKRSRDFSHEVEKSETVAEELLSLSHSLTTTQEEIREKSLDQEMLQSVLKIIPDGQRFLRTQNALQEEVQSLRSKISKQLGWRKHILIDTKTNKLFVKQGVKLLWDADCSVGRGGMLTDKKTGRKWEFVTPKGKFKILTKIENPTWIKPDWAFTENGEVPPPPNDPKRRVEGELGAYVLSLGDGYLIHGTKREDLLGQPASHGCVRLSADNLKKLYQDISVGTEVYIY